jgi:hypothetical protein
MKRLMGDREIGRWGDGVKGRKTDGVNVTFSMSPNLAISLVDIQTEIPLGKERINEN